MLAEVDTSASANKHEFSVHKITYTDFHPKPWGKYFKVKRMLPTTPKKLKIQSDNSGDGVRLRHEA